jgi:molybdopterin-guanine dinucleotide biosynthesis protein A
VKGGAVLGAVLAGGASVRFGDVKALAVVGGIPIAARAAGAVRGTVGNVVMIANQPTVPDALGLEWRPDLLPGAGPAAGIHAALCWAREMEMEGVVAVACDMPFVEPVLLQKLLDARHGCDIVLPASEGQRGIEPLCAWYGLQCIAAIEKAVQQGDRRMIGFHESMRVEVLPYEVVAAIGEPARMFLNVNTQDDLQRAERMERDSRDG